MGHWSSRIPLYEAADTFLYTPGEVAHGSTHVRDAIDLKRMMITVVMALVPVTLFGMWNVGYQANMAIEKMDAVGMDHDRRLALHDPQRTRIHQRFGLARRQFCARRAALHSDLHRLHVCGWPHRSGFQRVARPRDQRRIPGYRITVSADAAANDPALAGSGGDRVWGGGRQRSLWRYRT